VLAPDIGSPGELGAAASGAGGDVKSWVPANDVFWGSDSTLGAGAMAAVRDWRARGSRTDFVCDDVCDDDATGFSGAPESGGAATGGEAMGLGSGELTAAAAGPDAACIEAS